MKTIQKYFQECNKYEIIEQYLFQHPIILNPSSKYDSECTVQELLANRIKQLDNLIEKIKVSKIKSDETWVLFAYHSGEDYDINFAYMKKSDILNNPSILNLYGYEFCTIEETAGSLVADTPLTQHYLNDLLIDYLFESSFFGYDQEYLDEHISYLQELEENVEEAEQLSSKDVSCDLNIDLEPADENSKNIWLEFVKIYAEYGKKEFDIEIKKVAELLKG